MTTLRLAIDASGMRQGAQTALQQLTAVQRGARETAQAIDNIYGSGSRIFAQRTDDAARAVSGLSRSTIGAASGALAVGHNINLLSQQVRVLDGSFSSLHTTGLLMAQGLLDIAHIVHRVEDSGGAASTAFGKFLNILKANPLLTAVVALGAVSTAMSFFTSHTKEAADAQDVFNKALEEANRLTREREFDTSIGRPTALDPKAEVDRLRRLVVDLQGTSGEAQFSRKELAEQLRISTQETGRLAEGEGVAGHFVFPGFDISQPGLGAFQSPVERFSGEDLQKLARSRADSLAKSIPADKRPLDDFIASLQAETDGLRLSEVERAKSIALRQAEIAAIEQHTSLTEQTKNSIREEIELQKQLMDLRQLGSDVGVALGQGFFNAATGATSLRTALAGVLQQLIAIGQSRAVQGFGDFLGNAFASTAAQRSSPTVTGQGSNTITVIEPP